MNVQKLASLNRYFFDQETMNRFIAFLMQKAKVIAPHKKGEKSFAFQEVKDPEQVVLSYSRTMHPLKKYFLPPIETLLEFDLKENEIKKPEIPIEDRFFFGVHSYDMKAILLLDHSFKTGHPEANYLQRRERSFFIGVSYQPDEHHFAEDLGIDPYDVSGFSIFLDPVEKGYMVFEVDEIGKRLLNEFDAGLPLTTPLEYEEKEHRARLKMHHNRLPQIFEHVYHSKVWNEVAKRCVGCGTCNLLCATCYCFDVVDEVELDMTSGKRYRYWDGCMLNPFAEVAGGENFRPTLDSRTRHRLYRKFKYQTDQTGELHCVGCGRCSKFCPAGISMIEVINQLIDDYNKQQQAVSLV
ncbi:4Fe-4S ferredoxin iron-sulfur binding domain-containing protein [Caldithrix abyssi DSM 13497]|uniref:4Fe-4S ferredoxin iron-sulfur binding domain-containing protein n=1 Tax=Caldithrix abyssi DSM 13497 TaxID=880073 RepID=H1XQW8_CALAY|nr:4Fe-4S dicluster domain-containing protein [Caldithrix abyssi]APF19974.1 sulfhydrogenase beta subunit [Caldithrix abyssi DSM 13497]EHO40062.1 4Fe-4S ferredoxin iron-sulfur binding domain-containing protein [Caldithrix abyssi DSM 13497]